jgi:hypothetical protein
VDFVQQRLERIRNSIPLYLSPCSSQSNGDGKGSSSAPVELEDDEEMDGGVASREQERARNSGFVAMRTR